MGGGRLFTINRPGFTIPLLLTLLLATGAVFLCLKTWADLRPVPDTLRPHALEFRTPQFLDRKGIALSVTFDNPWNVHDWLPLHAIPNLLQDAFLASEDRRFYQHKGVDWLARAHALVQNIRAWRSVRGASTISEQTVRILHPRPRTLWSRWLEGLEAARLEERFSKAEIFEFYLNQVPYSRQRRGVLQAARMHFDRDPTTLNPAEMLTLAILVRAPGRLGRQHDGRDLAKPLRQLAEYLIAQGKLAVKSPAEISPAALPLTALHLPVHADHFLRHLTKQESPRQPGVAGAGDGPARVLTTLDADLQRRLQDILNQQLLHLQPLDVDNGAVLVADHQTDEILAWVNSGKLSAEDPGNWIDAVTSPRQPGSTLKPFLYALALDSGWTPATMIEDAPLARPVGNGMHPFRNYSRRHYGPLRLREALGNSLNIPAIRTVQFTGTGNFLARLQAMGMVSLDRTAGHYGEGLALGNGEVTLLELVRAYAVLARGGIFHPLRLTLDGTNSGPPRHPVFSREAALLIADILSDPEARRLEFGPGNILRFAVQTAVKTGTSNDHRDAWAIGFNHRYTVGVWMGNLDGHSTGGLTGITGPGLLLRSVFAELNRLHEAAPLPTSPRLAEARICSQSGLLAGPFCPVILERFIPGTLPATACSQHSQENNRTLAMDTAQTENGHQAMHILQPSPKLQMAMDPHIPDSVEAYPMKLAGNQTPEAVDWLINGQLAGTSRGINRPFMWPLTRGSHQVQARIHLQGSSLLTPEVQFTVK